jgi:hypothetical protein
MLLLLVLLGLVLCAPAPPAWSQESRPDAARERTAEPEEEAPERRPSPLMRIPALAQSMGSSFPGLGNYPLELLGLLMAPVQRREANLLPTMAFSEEFDDNIFMDNSRKRWELITGLTPAIMALVNRPQFQLAAGFSNTSELYARDSLPHDAFARQNFVGGVYYALTPHLSFTVADTFQRDQSPDAVAGAFSLGQGSWYNTFSPAVAWQIAPHTRLDVTGYYNVLRFDDPTTAVPSDTYGVVTTLSQEFTPRFTGNIAYNFTYLDLRYGHGDNATTHTPTIGFSYRVLPSLTFTLNGGAAFTHLGDEDFITGAGNAGLELRLPFGTTGLFYTRNVGVAGGFGGPTENQTVYGTLLLPTWKDLLIVLSPAWTQAKSLSDRQLQRVDVNVFTVTLGVAYRISEYLTAYGGYSFLRQRVGSSSTTLDVDADQNRVRVGLQFGYPIGFDLPW